MWYNTVHDDCNENANREQAEGPQAKMRTWGHLNCMIISCMQLQLPS